MRIAALCLTGLIASAGTAAAGRIVGPLNAPSAAVDGGVSYSVYLPDDADRADEAGAKRYPVVFLLHGSDQDQREWIVNGHVAETLDAMVAAGQISPMIAVMPDAGTSWYVDSARFGGPGDYATALVRDLIPEIDRRFPTLADQQHRAIAGVSMGGFGALRMAFTHPELFGGVVGLSAGLNKPGGLSWAQIENLSPGDRDIWFPRTFGAPFDPDIYAAETPFAYLPALAAAPAAPRIMLIVGDRDYFAFHDGTAELYLDLRAIGLRPEFRVADGAHDWAFWRPMSVDAFGFLDTVFRGPLAGQ